MDLFLKAAIEEARIGFNEGGIPIGSVLVYKDKIIGRGHNRRVQRGSVVLHGEMDALENGGRQKASVYKECTLYTTLSPCPMCSGTILLYGIPKVIVGENRTFMGEEKLLQSRGVEIQVLQNEDCIHLMRYAAPSRRPIRPKHRKMAAEAFVFLLSDSCKSICRELGIEWDQTVMGLIHRYAPRKGCV